FDTLKQSMVGEQTLEPVQVAGFNQFFDDLEAASARSVGVGFDYHLSPQLHGGIERLIRDLEVPVGDPFSGETFYTDWQERLLQAYLYWTPAADWALSLRYQRECFQRDMANVGVENLLDLKTQRLTLATSYFYGSRFSSRVAATYTHQDGDFFDPSIPFQTEGGDRFWVIDAALGLRLNRRSRLTLEALNLTNQRFNYQEMDANSPLFQPERAVQAKFSVVF
ncbi:MAG TPA: hypothetical protein VIS52_00555, partial [Motiliproteus sp.]